MDGTRLTDVVRERVEDAASKLADAMPTGDDIKVGAHRVSRFIRDNPMGATIASAAFGFIVGSLLPATRAETERIRDVRRSARGASAEAIDACRETVLQTVWALLGARTNRRS